MSPSLPVSKGRAGCKESCVSLRTSDEPEKGAQSLVGGGSGSAQYVSYSLYDDDLDRHLDSSSLVMASAERIAPLLVVLLVDRV